MITVKTMDKKGNVIRRSPFDDARKAQDFTTLLVAKGYYWDIEVDKVDRDFLLVFGQCIKKQPNHEEYFWDNKYWTCGWSSQKEGDEVEGWFTYLTNPQPFADGKRVRVHRRRSRLEYFAKPLSNGKICLSYVDGTDEKEISIDLLWNSCCLV